MRRIIPAFFVIVAMVLLVIFLTKKTSESAKKVGVQDLPVSGESQGEGFSVAENSLGIEDSAIVSFMPLRANETLLGSSGIDLNGDNFDDEILVVRKNENPSLYLIVGLYNPETTLYDRVAELRTEITQLRSLSYNGMDVTGDHRIALVYQGFTDDEQAVLQMFFCRRSGVVNIGSFKSDGTIFIQQYNRSETYNLSQSSGRSFPVWVYASDTRPGVGNLSQVQTEYNWDESAGRYVQTRQVFVTGKNIAAAELAKIQDGTVETFANYLNGLWYMTDSAEKEIRYIFFDYAAREVIFLEDDSQEIFSWQNSNLYRNGIYLSTVNVSVENLRRRFDIGLTGLNEIRVRVLDDVGMRIQVDALWNGQYKKMNMRRNFNSVEEVPQELTEIREKLEQVPRWIAPNGISVAFKNGSYKIDNEGRNENGVYFLMMVKSAIVVQFNSRAENRYFDEVYTISRSQTSDTFLFRPAKILSSDVYEIPGKIITLSAVE
ncbi:MAG: pallilysin-related adhesin [Treponemataceae bacterium]|nr:pallilysin-related adhesin [Treponemataceae bacterium]